jgi:serine/threonine protein kinase
MTHRDLKSLNVLLDDTFLPRLCDFGIARFLDESETVTMQLGTPNWMAP